MTVQLSSGSEVHSRTQGNMKFKWGNVKNKTSQYGLEVCLWLTKQHTAQSTTIKQQFNAASKLQNATSEDVYSISSNCFKIYFLINSMLMKGFTKQQQ